MRWAKTSTKIQEADMTPMIDMVFQLIAFFMVVINFSEADQNQRIHLPSSELAKPPDAPLESPITVNVISEETAIIGAQEVPIAGLTRLLTLEHQVLVRKGEGKAREATIIIRADGSTEHGVVQQVIQICQQVALKNSRAPRETARTRHHRLTDTSTDENPQRRPVGRNQRTTDDA